MGLELPKWSVVEVGCNNNVCLTQFRGFPKGIYEGDNVGDAFGEYETPLDCEGLSPLSRVPLKLSPKHSDSSVSEGVGARSLLGYQSLQLFKPLT